MLHKALDNFLWHGLCHRRQCAALSRPVHPLRKLVKICPYCGAAMRDLNRDERIYAMWRTGKTKREIGEAFGVSSTTVKKAIERVEIEQGP